MVLAEGSQMKAKRINEKQLAKTWKTLSNKPLPKIKALKLKDKDFNQQSTCGVALKIACGKLKSGGESYQPRVRMPVSFLVTKTKAPTTSY